MSASLHRNRACEPGANDTKDAVIAIGLQGCVYRKLDSAISVVKSTEYGPRRDDTKALDQPMDGNILVQ